MEQIGPTVVHDRERKIKMVEHTMKMIKEKRFSQHQRLDFMRMVAGNLRNENVNALTDEELENYLKPLYY